jgi:flagellar biosynthetic protein FliR
MLIAYIIGLTMYEKDIYIELDVLSIGIMAIKEVLTGLTLGFALHFVFWGISYAGSLMGFSMGLAIAQAFNPVDETNSNIVGQMLYFGAFLIFFLINGHHYLIQSLAFSFTVIPFGNNPITGSVVDLITMYSAGVFILAVKIASPILVSFFLVQIAEGIMARAIPQMQVFFVTQPLKLGLGFILLSMILPVYVYVIKNLLESYEDSLFSLIKGMVS